MKTYLLGTPEDVRGFALAGIAGTPCTTPEEVEEAAAGLETMQDLALVLVSQEVAQLAPEAVEKIAREHGPPAVVVLP